MKATMKKANHQRPDEPSTGQKSVIVYSQPGQGKSQFAQQLRRFYKLDHVEDGWDGNAQSFQPTGVLYLTNCPPKRFKDCRRVISLDDAMAAIVKSSGMTSAETATRVH